MSINVPIASPSAQLVPAFALPLAAVLFLSFGLGPNYQLALVGCLVLIVGFGALWRPGETPILLFIFLHQWMQACLPPFYGNWKNLPVDQLTLNAGNQQLASLLSMLGLAIMAGGMRMGAGSIDLWAAHVSKISITRVPYATLLRFFVGVWIAASACRFMAAVIPGLSQLFLALASLKWAAFTLLTYSTFATANGKFGWWFAVFLAEFALSLGGYFSTFKEVFLYTLIALGASQVRVTPKQAFAVVIFLATLVLFAVIWTAVKVDYRAFVRGDESAQVVTVSFGVAIAELFNLIFKVSAADMYDAVDAMFNRIMYTEFFGVVLGHVPAVVPHEYGALWWDAITRPVMPRLLFPDKAIIDESLLLNTYTGLGVAGMAEGTQISLGYMTDAYIDFGEFGMMPVLFLVGLAIGRLYRWVLYGVRTYGLAGLAMAPVALMPAAAFEVSSAKLVGGLFAQILAVWLVARFIVPRFLPWALPDARWFQR